MKDDKKEYALRIAEASRTGLIVIIYEIAIEYLERAQMHFEKNEIKEYRFCLKQAKIFINRLNSSLNLEYTVGGELHRLYMFMNTVIIKADIRKDITEVVRIIVMLKQLKEAFVQVEKQDDSGPLMENTQQIYAGLTYSKDSLNENMYSGEKRGFQV